MRLYDNSRTVADEAAILNDFQTRSRQAYQAHAYHSDRYADHPRQRFDVFHAATEQAPVLVFIHGGYWQWCDNSDFGFIVNAPLQDGWEVVLVEYPLTPDASFAEVVQSIGLALDDLAMRPEYKHRQVSLCGHSAGGHLAAIWQHHPLVNQVCAISGLYDLKPLQATHLNDALQLQANDIEKLSPMTQAFADKPLHIVYGGQELAELQQQSVQYAQTLTDQGHKQLTLINLETKNHYDILDAVFGADGYFLKHFAKA